MITFSLSLEGGAEEIPECMAMLKALFGYNGNPSLADVISYALYFAVIIVTIHRENQEAMKPAEGSR